MINPYARAVLSPRAIGFAMSGRRPRRFVNTVRRYATRRNIKAASTIARFARKYVVGRARRSFQKVGERIGTTNARTEATNTAGILNTRTLYNVALNDLDRGTALNQRERDHVRFSGVKCCIEYRNASGQPLYLNVAVIGLKATSGNVPDTQNFFRGSTDSRTISFSTALTSIQFHCLPINTDDYVIMRHKRMLLASDLQGEGAYKSDGRAFGSMEFYVKINRQIRYFPESTVPTDGRIFLVYWADKHGEPGGALAQSNAFVFNMRHVQYYHNPKE